MAKYFGLILLIAAVASVLYLISNADNLLNSKFNIPGLKLPSVSLPEFTSLPKASDTSISTQKLVRINSLRGANSYNSYTELTISADLPQDEAIDITGWKVRGNNESFFTVPQAKEVYSFGGLEGDIKLRNGDLVHFYSGFGPKGNFHLNKCMGYIEEFTNFVPSFPKICPYISRSEIQSFSGSCQDYLLSLNACENPLANPPVPFEDNACHAFLSKLNYVGCVEKYQGDGDFLSRDWMVWMGNQMDIFDFTHDKIQLLDKSGNVVDEYVY